MLFNRLFESFETLSAKDADDGSLEGITSVYKQDVKSMLGMALDSLSDNQSTLGDSIVKVYAKINTFDTPGSIEDFRKFSNLLSQAFAKYDVLKQDNILRKKLCDVITFVYSKKNSGNLIIYSNFTSAKDVTRALYSELRNMGLSFVSSEVDDLLQKIILSVLYRKSNDSETSGNNKKQP